MVLKSKEDCSFSAFHGLFVPRAPRSARRRSHFDKKVEDSDSQICAFELLASLANELLQDTKSSAALNDASKRHDQPATVDDPFQFKLVKENLLNVECIDQGRCEESVSIPEFIAPKSGENCNLTESSYSGSDLTVQHYSGCLEKINHGFKPVINSQNLGNDCYSKVDSGSLISEKDVSITDGFCRPQHSDDQKGDGLAINDIPSANDPAKLDMEFPALINKDKNVEVPSHRDSFYNASIVKLGNDLKLGITDDDENFRKGVRDDDENFRDDLILGCRDDDENLRNDLQVVIREDDGIFSRHNKPGTRPLTSSIRDDDAKFARGNNYSNRPRAFRHLSRVGARRIKNLLSSKCWKSSPKWKDCELPKVAYFDGRMKPLFRKRKIHHSRERYLHETLNKRRKLANRRLVVTSGRGFSSKRVFNSPETRMHVGKNDFTAVFNDENEISSPTICHQTSFSSKDSHVKFCIKSFRIPELLIEVPETTTVGSLKRTVMETLTAVLGSRLHVGMLLHGKKVRDDNRTLLQTGMTSKENLDSLGFTLEPTVCTKNPIIPLSYDTSQLASRSAALPVFNSGISDALPGPSPLISSGDNTRSYHELPSSCANKLSDKKLPDSRALVSVAPVGAYSCGVVPVNHRTRQPEHLQRRARRPFSVREVESLVQAVERFGTGRWRDVKLLYFETSEHRTYVDLKDKWKTLVHTAQIPPQQRRGEPVPQELLDRVLAAHAYWSLQQAKQQYTN